MTDNQQWSKSEIISYAIKGINADIEQSEKIVYKANQYIYKLEHNEPINSTKTKTEIEDIKKEHTEKVKQLIDKREQLSWEYHTGQFVMTS